MTDQDKNTLIAKALSAGPDAKWGQWAWLECFECVFNILADWWRVCPSCANTGRIPRDFAAPENTLLLVEWASGQEWYDSALEYDGTIGQVGGHIRHYMDRLQIGLVDAPETARQVRDIIAARLKEIEDGTQTET